MRPRLWLAFTLLLPAIEEQLPGTSFLSPLYREPVCVDVRK